MPGRDGTGPAGTGSFGPVADVAGWPLAAMVIVFVRPVDIECPSSWPTMYRTGLPEMRQQNDS